MSEVIQLIQKPEPPKDAVAVFNEGDSCFIVDDHCYVLKNYGPDGWGSSAWIFGEALDVLKTLPKPS